MICLGTHTAPPRKPENPTERCFLQVKHGSSHLLCFQAPLCSPLTPLEPSQGRRGCASLDDPQRSRFHHHRSKGNSVVGLFGFWFFFLREGGRGKMS